MWSSHDGPNVHEHALHELNYMHNTLIKIINHCFALKSIREGC